MDFFGSIGNFLGSLFGGGQKKKKDEPKPVVVQPTATLPKFAQPTQTTPLFQNGTVKQPPTLVLQQDAPLLGGVKTAAPKPAVPKAADNPKPAQPTPLLLDQTPKVTPILQQKPKDISIPKLGRYDGLSAEDRAFAEKADASGRDASGFIKATRDAAASKRKAEYDNSFIGKAGNFVEEIGNIVGAPVKGLGEGFGAALASFSPEVRTMNETIDANRAEELRTIQQLTQRLNDPSLDPVTRARMTNLRRNLLTQGPSEAEQAQATLYGDMAQATNPTDTLVNSVGTALLPFVGGLTGAGSRTVGGEVIKGVVDPISLLEKIPKNNVVGRFFNTELSNVGRNKVAGMVEDEVAKYGTDMAENIIRDGDEAPVRTPTIEEPRVPREPSSPITSSPTTNKAPAITSPNRPAPTVQQPQPFEFGANRDGISHPNIAAGIDAPVLQVPAKNALREGSTLDTKQAQEVKQALDEATTKAPEQPAPVQSVVAEAPSKTEAKQAAKNAPIADPEAVVDAKAAAAESKAPTDAIAKSIKTADSVADDILKTSKSELASQGTDYGDLVAKLYANSGKDAVPVDLTATERAVQKKIKPHLDKVIAKMNKLGITDDDMGYIREYLPSTLKDELGAVHNLDDVLGKDFGFTQTRKGKLTPEQVKEGSEQALRDYLRTGELLDHLPKEAVENIKLARRDNEFKDLIEVDGKGGDTGLRLTDEEIGQARTINQELARAENARAEAQERVTGGDKSPEAISAANKAEADANDAYINKQVNDYITLEKKTDEAIKQIRKSGELTEETKRQRISQLESHLTDVRNQTYYVQSTTRTNLLLGVGRIADQVNKGVVAIDDALTGAAKIGANKSFNNSTGRNLFGDNPTVNAVWDQVKGNPALSQARTNAKIAEGILQRQNEGKGAVAKAFNAYRMAGTKVTEAGSRFKVASKDTVSYFTSKAQAEGITDVDGITRYVQDAMGSSEWKRVQTKLFEARNSFTGLPNSGGAASRDLRLNARNAIYNKLGDVPGLSRSMRENIADGVTIPIVGFPRLLVRLGARGFDNASLGLTDFIRASRITPKNEADALKKALLVQQGLRSAQNGAALGGLGFMLGASDMVTGAYPSDPSERARWEKDKIQPFSLKIGDQYVEPGRYLGPLAFPLMLGAAIGRGNPQDIPATTLELTKQFLSNFGADSIGDVMEATGKILKGDFDGASKDMTRWAAGITAAFIPASSALNTAGKAQDMIQDKAAPDGSGSYSDALRARLPGVREGLPERTDSLGNPISQGNALDLLPGVSGGQNTNRAKNDARQDTVMAEIDRLAKAKFEVMPARDVKNTNSQNDAKSLMEGDLYKNASDEKKAEYMKKTLLGSKTKDINKGLDANQRKAMIEYTLQSKDERTKWLENNDNAAGYYQADYDNAKANNTLTAYDDNLDHKDGKKYKAIRAKVNQEFGADTVLQNLYRDTDQTEWRAMTDPESDDYDPEKAGRLLAYDEARTKAGVSGKSGSSSKPKYTQKKAGSGRGVNGGNFAFASTPASLIGTGSAGKYADEAPLFRPLPDLKAPTEANIPKGRTISVKRGFQL